MSVRRYAAMAACVVMLAGCQTAYYGAMEKFGYEKRHILVDRVKEARDDQQAAKEQFTTALQQFRAVTGFTGGQLGEAYDTLNASYERSRARADAVHNSIQKVENVAEALFKEWKAELDEYTNEALRRESAQKFTITQDRYAELIAAMKRAEGSIGPVLATFHDQVLFIKHNLNAQAIASLQGQLTAIETDVGALIREMERSIAEANEFIGVIGKEEAE